MLHVSPDDVFDSGAFAGERLPLPTADRFPQGWRLQYIKMMEATWLKTPAQRPTMVCWSILVHILLLFSRAFFDLNDLKSPTQRLMI